jgi:hypothetical protein
MINACSLLQIHSNTNLNYKFEWIVNKSNLDNNSGNIFSVMIKQEPTPLK